MVIIKNFNLPFLLVPLALLGTWASASPIVLAPERANHATTLMNTGAVLITGGVNETGTLDSTLLYDPDFQEFTYSSLGRNVVPARDRRIEISAREHIFNRAGRQQLSCLADRGRAGQPLDSSFGQSTAPREIGECWTLNVFPSSFSK